MSLPFHLTVFLPALSAWKNRPGTASQRVQDLAPLGRLRGIAVQRLALPFATIPRALRCTANVVVAASVSV